MAIPKVSIIVPFFNTSAYIARCTKSLLIQTLSNTEIIFIDDGSTDDSLSKLKPLVKNKSFARIIKQKKNQGIPTARNIGLEAANGEYITFVDSDDTIAPNFCEETYQIAQKKQADIVITDSINCNIDGIFSDEIRAFPKDELQNPKHSLKLCLFGRIPCNNHSKLYKKTLFEKKRFQIDRYHEDAILIPKIIADARVISFTKNTRYFYYRRSESASTTKSQKHWDDRIYTMQSNLFLAKKYELSWLNRQLFLVLQFRHNQYISQLGYWKTYRLGQTLGSQSLFIIYFFLQCYSKLKRRVKQLFYGKKGFH